MSREELMQQYEDTFGIDIPRGPAVKVEASVYFSAPVNTVADLRALVARLDEFQVSDESGVECDRATIWVEAALGDVTPIQCGCSVGGPYPVDFLVMNHDCPEA
jgi:hypothetical protein